MFTKFFPMTTVPGPFEPISAEDTASQKFHKETGETNTTVRNISSLAPWLPLYIAVGGLVLGNFNAIANLNQNVSSVQAQVQKINEDIIDLHNDIREDRGVSQKILELMIDRNKQ